MYVGQRQIIPAVAYASAFGFSDDAALAVALSRQIDAYRQRVAAAGHQDS
jgi:hypothetical protein